jgi:hypothetical protein
MCWKEKIQWQCYPTTEFDVTAGLWPVYLWSGQSNRTKIGPLGQMIFSGHLGQQLSFLPTGRLFVLPCHSISTDNIIRIIQSLYYSPASHCINAWMHSLIKCQMEIVNHYDLCQYGYYDIAIRHEWRVK